MKRNIMPGAFEETERADMRKGGELGLAKSVVVDMASKDLDDFSI